MREETVVVPNDRAEEFDTSSSEYFNNVTWEAESSEFHTTFTVWNAFTSEESDEEVGRFVDFAEHFQ